MDEKQIHEAYKPCERCLAMDVLLQANFMDLNRERYMANIGNLFEHGTINPNKFGEIVSNCAECYLSRKKASQISKKLRPDFESVQIQDPFKSE